MSSVSSRSYDDVGPIVAMEDTGSADDRFIVRRRLITAYRALLQRVAVLEAELAAATQDQTRMQQEIDELRQQVATLQQQLQQADNRYEHLQSEFEALRSGAQKEQSLLRALQSQVQAEQSLRLDQAKKIAVLVAAEQRREVERKQHDCMMRVAELVSLLDHCLSRSMNKKETTLADVLDLVHSKELTEEQQTAFNVFVTELRLAETPALPNITAVRKAMQVFKKERNYKSHDLYHINCSEEESCQLIQQFSGWTAEAKRLTELERNAMENKGKALIRLVYRQLGLRPFAKDNQLQEE